MSRIDAYLDSVFDAFSATGRIVPWPIHIATIFPYFSDLEARELYDRLRLVAPAGPAAVAQMHINSSVAKALLMDLIPGLKELPDLTTADRVWFVETVFDSLEVISHGDIFCRDGRYVKLSGDDVSKLRAKAAPSLEVGDPVKCRFAYRLSAAAQALIWSLFFYGWTDVAFEIHGPYRVIGSDGGESDLVVREFLDLRPLAVWPGMKLLPITTLTVIAEMDIAACSRIDVFNHLTHKGNLHEQTAAVAVLMDGQPVTDDGAWEEVVKDMVAAQQSQHEHVRNLSRSDLIHKFIETRYYAFRKWREPFGLDWRPPEEVAQRLKTWEPIVIPLEGGPSPETLRRAYDPRDPFNF